MATLRTDELNSQEFDAAEYIRNYFKPMEISDERKKVREEASEDFRDVLLFLFALITAYSDHDIMDWAAIQSEYRVQFEQTALKYARDSESLQDYIKYKTSDFIDITRENDLTDPYWTSDERATKEAVNDANTVITGEEWQKAIDAGAVKKRWKTQNDEIVRKSHRKVNRVSVAIDRFFVLDRGMLRYPGDEYYSKEESINCRCGLDFLDADGKVVGIYWTKRGELVNKTRGKVQFTNKAVGNNIDYKSEALTKQFANARFATGSMSPGEFARATELWKTKREAEGLTAKEKEHVYEELDNNLTAEEKGLCIVKRAIGDYWYTAINKGHNQYKIIYKDPIDPYEDWMDEVMSEVIGRDWKKYDI